MKRGGRVGVAATLFVLLGLPGGAASASVDLDDVASSLRRNPVYVEADAERALTDDEMDELRSVIRSADTPIYIAVLPASTADLAGGDTAEVASQFADTVIDLARSVLSSATVSTPGVASWLLAKLASWRGRRRWKPRGMNAAVLDDFVERVGDAAGSASGSGESGDGGDDGGSGGGWVLPVVLVGGAGGGRGCGCGSGDDVERTRPSGCEPRRPIVSC